MSDRIVKETVNIAVQQRQVPTVQTVQNTVKIPQGQFLDKVVDMPVVVERQVSTVADAPTTMNEKGRWSQTVTDRMIQEADRCRDEEEINKAKVEAQNGMEKDCVTMRNAAVGGKFKFKLEAGDKEETEKTVQGAGNWLDKNMLAENDEFEAQQKELEGTDRLINVPVAIQHQVPAIQRGQRTAEVPKVEFIDKVMDVPGVIRGLVPNIQSTQKTVEVPRVQFIDRVVDDPAVMQREAFNIEARELIEDDSVGAKQQGSERPLSPKKRRFPVETESGFQSGEQFDLDAESNHERFKDLVLPSPQSCSV